MYSFCMGKRGPKPRQLIDTSWRPELAYCVGLLSSDGCLSSDGRHIELTSNDIEQLETFRRILGIEHIHVGTKVRGYQQRSSTRIEFGSVLFYDWLMSIGLTPAKSKTIGPLHIPDEYFFDFYRGCFDGDGSMYAFWDARWQSSYTYATSLASASLPFLEWVKLKAGALLGAKGSIRTGKRVYELRFAKRATQLLFLKMYEDSEAPRLTRKFAKLQEIIRIDTIHRIML